MPRTPILIKHKWEHKIFYWSTITDTPVSWLMNIDEYIEYVKFQNWEKWVSEVNLKHLKKYWSYRVPQYYKNVREIVKFNRCWPNEWRYSYKKLIESIS